MSVRSTGSCKCKYLVAKRCLTLAPDTDGLFQEILHNIDPMYSRKGASVSQVFDTSVQAALRYGDWKILTGDPGFDKWVPEPKLHPNCELTVQI